MMSQLSNTSGLDHISVSVGDLNDIFFISAIINGDETAMIYLRLSDINIIVLWINMNLITNKREFVNKVGKLSKRECYQLLRILKVNNVKFTENLNGCYVNIGSIDNNIFEKISTFVNLCLDFQAKNNIRDETMRQLEEEFEINRAQYQEYPHHENEKLNAIKQDKNLNSLEKSIMKENLKQSMTEKSDFVHRKSLTPKYSGIKARLLKNCRSITKPLPNNCVNADTKNQCEPNYRNPMTKEDGEADTIFKPEEIDDSDIVSLDDAERDPQEGDDEDEIEELAPDRTF